MSIGTSGAVGPDLPAATQRALAAHLFNRTWELLESSRSPADDRTMLACALASRLHWSGIGTDETYSAGDWLVAHVASRLDHADLALEFAASAYDTAVGAEPPAPVSNSPPPCIRGTIDSIFALVPSSRIGNRSVR